jgi:hypothetical protein
MMSRLLLAAVSDFWAECCLSVELFGGWAGLSARNCKGKTVEQLGSRAFASRGDDEPDGTCVARQLVSCGLLCDPSKKSG